MEDPRHAATEQAKQDAVRVSAEQTGERPVRTGDAEIRDMTEKKSEPGQPELAAEQQVSRVKVLTDKVLVGTQEFSREALQSWRGWDGVLRAAQTLDPPLTVREVTELEQAATTQAGKNGYAEFSSAMAGTRKAKPG